MAVTFQAVGTAVSATTGTLTVAWPAHVADDIALLWVTSSGGGTTETLATANGFTLITTQVTGTGTAGTKLSVYWARATSSAMAAPVVTAGTDFKYGVITTYRGAVTTSSPINVSAGAVKATASTAATLPAVTTLDPNCMVVLGISSDVDAATAFLTSTTNANLTSKTERFDAGTVSGLGGGIAVTDGIKATAGSTGTTSAVVVSSINAMITVALTPARTGTSTATIKLAASGAGKDSYTPPTTNLQYQYRADDITGVTSGAGLATWTPTVGTGNLTQATALNQPTWVDGVINGHAVVRWPDAANSLFMTGTTTADAQPTTIVTVLKGGTTIDLQQIQPWHWGVEMHAESGFWKIYAGTSLNGAAGSVDDSVWVVITAVYNGTTSAIYKNGTLIASGPAGATGVGTTLNMGRHSNGTRNWRGDIAEVLRYDGALSDTDRAAVHTYVQTMYGITVATAPLSLPVSDTFTGTNGAAWDSALWTLQSGTAPVIQSNRGYYAPTTSTDMLLSGMPDSTDVDVTFTLRLDTVGTQWVAVYVNASAAFQGYTVDFAPTFGSLSFYSSISNDLYWTDAAFTFTAATDYKFRVKRYGATLYFKWWLGANAEPSTWTYSGVDSAPAPAAKTVVQFLEGPVYIDDLTVAASTVELESKTGSETATLKLAASGAPVKRVDGTRTAALVLSASRTASSTRTGAATATLKLAATRSAAGVHAGTSTGTVKLAATGAGTKTATGTRTATVRLFASGAGTDTKTSTRTAALRLTAEGISGDKVGQASATIRLLATTAQNSVRTGAATATLKLAATRTAAPVRTGTRTATLKLASTGTGIRTHAATGTATFHLGLTVTTSLQKTSTATGTMWLASSYTASSIRTNLAAAILLLVASGVGVKFLTLTNITVTATLLPRRWDAELTNRNKTGALLERDNTGTLLERTNTGTLTPRRWDAELE